MVTTQDNYKLQLKSRKLRLIVNLCYLLFCISIPYYYSEKMVLNNYIGWLIVGVIFWALVIYQVTYKNVISEKRLLRKSRREVLKMVRIEEVFSVMKPTLFKYFAVFKKDGYKEIRSDDSSLFSIEMVGKEHDVFIYDDKCVVPNFSNWELVPSKDIVAITSKSPSRKLKGDSLVIRKILLEGWDPLEIGDLEECQDEYDNYIYQVLKLCRARERDELSRYLLGIETGAMALEVDTDTHLDYLDTLSDRLITAIKHEN